KPPSGPGILELRYASTPTIAAAAKFTIVITRGILLARCQLPLQIGDLLFGTGDPMQPFL
ncbi:MAG TPA: hypothetical protein VKJ01_25070, partial [Candidatus Solibacter sp.]|nr:hypothetical protein [Candidatus Solibacter sp.]